MATTLQRKSSGGIIFVIITKIVTNEIVPRNYFVIISLRAQRLKKFKIALRDCNFQSRLKFSSAPPTKPLFLWGILKARD